MSDSKPTKLGDLCRCKICQDDPDTSKTRTATCRHCGSNEWNVQVRCYRNQSGQMITSAGLVWTALHGWSRCEGCGSRNAYIHRGQEDTR